MSGSSLSLCRIEGCWNHSWWVPLPRLLLSISAVTEQSHVSFTPSPKIYALSKMGIPVVLNPGLNEMETALSKLSGFIPRMSHRLLFPHPCSPSQTFLFLFPTFYFLRFCIYLLLVALFHILFSLTLFLVGDMPLQGIHPLIHSRRWLTDGRRTASSTLLQYWFYVIVCSQNLVCCLLCLSRDDSDWSLELQLKNKQD